MAKVPDKYKRDLIYGRAMSWGPLYQKHFPHNTDPASRHTRIIASDILRDVHSPVRRLLIDAGYEPDHWASSIETTVECLWEARAKLREMCPHHWQPARTRDGKPISGLEKCRDCGATRDTETA